MNYKVIDNFLDEDDFKDLEELFIFKGKLHGSPGQIPWYYTLSVAWPDQQEDNIFYMTHKLYDDNTVDTRHYYSKWYTDLMPLLEKLEQPRKLLRVKANLYPNTEILHEHPMHIDYPFSHTGALLSLNTCDGYTKLKDGTKINSVANRILFFDASEEHCSTTTTNVPARFNININYLGDYYV